MKTAVTELREKLDNSYSLLDVLAELFAFNQQDQGKHILVRMIQSQIRETEQSLSALDKAEG